MFKASNAVQFDETFLTKGAITISIWLCSVCLWKLALRHIVITVVRVFFTWAQSKCLFQTVKQIQRVFIKSFLVFPLPKFYIKFAVIAISQDDYPGADSGIPERSGDVHLSNFNFGLIGVNGERRMCELLGGSGAMPSLKISILPAQVSFPAFLVLENRLWRHKIKYVVTSQAEKRE